MRAVFCRVSIVRPLCLAATNTKTITATSTRQLTRIDTFPRSTVCKALDCLSTTPSSRHLFSTSVQHRLVHPKAFNSTRSRTFALEGHGNTSTPNAGAAQKSPEGAMTASMTTSNAPSVNCSPKRRASCELLPIGSEHALKQRIVPVSYGTSVFFNRALSTFAAPRSQEKLPIGTQEASPSSPSAESTVTSSTATAEQPRAMVIQLTDQEAKICEVLDQVAKNYEAKEGKKVELRIAGGWVRDKVIQVRILESKSEIHDQGSIV